MTLAPGAIVFDPLIVGVFGGLFAVIVFAAEVAEQPFASVTVTEYEPAALTVIDCVVAPVDQRLPVSEDDVSVTLPPGQNDVPPLIVGTAGAAFAVTTLATDVAEHPFASVTVTV